MQRLILQGEQADLGPVTVGHDDLVVTGELSDRRDGRRDVRALGRGVGGLTSTQERIATECDDYPHDLLAVSTPGDHRVLVLSSVRWLSACDRGSGLDGLCAG